VLTATYNGLAARLTRARYMSNRLRPDRWQTAMDEHDAILAALVAREGETLGTLLARHLRNKRDIIVESLAAS
jgi:DNA-binding GntR family transcriptional regulator